MFSRIQGIHTKMSHCYCVFSCVSTCLCRWRTLYRINRTRTTSLSCVCLDAFSDSMAPWMPCRNPLRDICIFFRPGDTACAFSECTHFYIQIYFLCIFRNSTCRLCLVWISQIHILDDDSVSKYTSFNHHSWLLIKIDNLGVYGVM
jgi:hypothetical protein